MISHPLANRFPVPLERNRLPRNSPLSSALALLGNASLGRVATVVDPLLRDESLARLEAVLMAADEPLPLKRLVTASGLADAGKVRRSLAKLMELYELDGTAFQVRELAGGYQLQTRPEFHPWLARLRRGQTDLKLSPAARETLTIIAYRQPITRADVEGVRGVQSGEVLRQLMEKGLVRIAGRDDTLGRPVLYATTRKFLQLYGLNNLKDLPMSDAMGVEPRSKTKKTEDPATD